MEAKDVKIGDLVTYYDPTGTAHAALVTAVWPSYNPEFPGINVVYVSADPNRGDSYGRQVERDSSVAHESWKVAHGRYWKLPGA